MVTIKERLEMIQDKEKFAEAVKDAKSSEEMIEVLNSFGIETTVEEVENEFYSIFKEETGELDENKLDEVSGGCSCGGWLQHCFYQFGRWIIKMVGKYDIGDCQ